VTGKTGGLTTCRRMGLGEPSRAVLPLCYVLSHPGRFESIGRIVTDITSRSVTINHSRRWCRGVMTGPGTMLVRGWVQARARELLVGGAVIRFVLVVRSYIARRLAHARTRRALVYN
jgi:hypothetical protein